MNLHSNAATPVASKENISNEKLIQKNSAKKTPSKMFDKIFDAMNNSYKSNNKTVSNDKQAITLSKGNSLLRGLNWPVLLEGSKDNNSKESIKALQDKVFSTDFGTKNSDLESALSTLKENLVDDKSFSTVLNQITSASKRSVEAKNDPFEAEAISTLNAPKTLLENRGKKNKGNDTTLDKLLSEIKSAKSESAQLQLYSQPSSSDSNWIVTDFKTDKMKLSDWIEAFKNDIQKLNSFKVENPNKVSLTLRNEHELIKVTVEKIEGVIQIKASATQESKDNLEFILSEIQLEMKEKDIEFSVIVEDDDNEQPKDSNDEKRNSDDEKGEQENDDSN